MKNLNFMKFMNSFLDTVFANIDMAHAFGTCSFAPINRTLIIVENRSWFRKVKAPDFRKKIPKHLNGLRTLISSLNLGLTRTATCPFLALKFPQNWARSQKQNMSTNGTCFQKRNFATRDSRINSARRGILRTPVSIAADHG